MNGHSHSTSVNAQTVKKILIYGIILFILAVAQCSFFANLTFLPATPNIVLGALAAVALLETRQTSTVFAIGAGFIADAIGGSGIPVSAVIMLIFSVILSTLATKVLKNFLVWSLMLTVASLLGTLSTYLRLVIGGYANDLSFVFLKILIPELLMTVLFSLPLYFIFKPATKFCASKGKFKI